MKMQILIADKFPDKYIQMLRDYDLDVTYEPKLGENDLRDAAKEMDILVVRSTKVNATTIDSALKLNLIIRAGAGYNNIDIPTANKKGIYVANIPGKNSIAVAELAIGHMIALDRRIPDNVIDFRNKKWNKSEYSKAQGLFGKTLAIVGYGNIGKEVAKRAIAFGMNVYVKDIARIEGYGIKDFSEFDKTLPIADVISVHLPITPETKNLFNDKMFSYMKDEAIFINTSRAGVVDEDALLRAIESKNLRVGLDVFKDEPEGKVGVVNSKLQNYPNVYVTHHIGASTQQAQNAVAEETVNIILKFINSGVIAHWVNRANPPKTYFQLAVKHYDKPGVLASVMEVLKEQDMNVEQVENVIFDGGLVALCTMKLNNPLSSDTLTKIKNCPEVMTVSHVAL